MGMIIAVCGQKGGTGKTTTAYSIAAEMVSRGRKVLVVDADPQGSARTWVARALAEKHPAPTVIAMYETMYQPGQLEQFQGQFAVVVIDCPPGHAESERPVAIQRAALAVADLAILPCGPSALDAWSMAESLDLAKAAQVRYPKLRVVGLITKKKPRTSIGAGARAVLENAGLVVLNAELHDRVAYQEAPASGLGPAQYAASDDPIRLEIAQLVDEIERLGGMRKNGKGKASDRRATASG